jgi:hypothetical protein
MAILGANITDCDTDRSKLLLFPQRGWNVHLGHGSSVCGVQLRRSVDQAVTIDTAYISSMHRGRRCVMQLSTRLWELVVVRMLGEDEG